MVTDLSSTTIRPSTIFSGRPLRTRQPNRSKNQLRSSPLLRSSVLIRSFAPSAPPAPRLSAEERINTEKRRSGVEQSFYGLISSLQSLTCASGQVAPAWWTGSAWTTTFSSTTIRPSMILSVKLLRTSQPDRSKNQLRSSSLLGHRACRLRSGSTQRSGEAELRQSFYGLISSSRRIECASG